MGRNPKRQVCVGENGISRPENRKKASLAGMSPFKGKTAAVAPYKLNGTKFWGTNSISQNSGLRLAEVNSGTRREDQECEGKRCKTLGLDASKRIGNPDGSSLPIGIKVEYV